MKLQAEIGDNKHEIELRFDNEDIYAVIDRKVFDTEVSMPEPDLYLIKHKGKIFEAFVVGDPPDKPKTVYINGREYKITLHDPKRLQGSTSKDEQADGIAEIRSAMPGKVVRIILEPGAIVESGDGVLVVEAMKMQNELKSPKSGTVKEIRVSEGDTVSAGDVLAIIE